jgi:hypothetical protein
MLYSILRLQDLILDINDHVHAINVAPLRERRLDCEGGEMHSTELYRKYRGLIVALADERRSADLSLAALHGLLQEFQDTAAELKPAAAAFVCEELADQLEHEAIRSTRKHRRDVLLAAVKAFDGMTFAHSK